MNKLLQRQMTKHLGNPGNVPLESRPLFEAISDAYDSFDADRRLIERSLDISSQELTEINHRLRGEIAEHRTTDDELRHSVSLLTATLESTADGILVDDRCGHIKGFNKKFAAMWGVPESILASKEAAPLLSFMLGQLKYPEKTVANVQRFKTDPMAETSVVIYLKDGRVFDRHSKPQILDGRIVGRVWCFRDITAQTQLVQQLEDANVELEKVNKELNSFAYIVSHDLKAPLRGIKTLAGWIATDCEDRLDAEGKEQLSLLLTRVDRMHDLIDGILQYSRIGRITEEKKPVDLNELVPQVIDLLAAPEHIEIRILDPLPVVECERTRITQVFQNLIGNAIKYRDKPHGQITIGCNGADGWWTFRVADNGPGIDKKYHDRIFQLFQTLSPRDTYESTGIGLTMVKKIVELNRGKIWIESQLGEGCTFLFTLPQRIPGEVPNERLETCVTG